VENLWIECPELPPRGEKERLFNWGYWETPNMDTKRFIKDLAGLSALFVAGYAWLLIA